MRDALEREETGHRRSRRIVRVGRHRAHGRRVGGSLRADTGRHDPRRRGAGGRATGATALPPKRPKFDEALFLGGWWSRIGAQPPTDGSQCGYPPERRERAIRSAFAQQSTQGLDCDPGHPRWRSAAEGRQPLRRPSRSPRADITSGRPATAGRVRCREEALD
jgi:hypothetical protein